MATATIHDPSGLMSFQEVTPPAVRGATREDALLDGLDDVGLTAVKAFDGAPAPAARAAPTTPRVTVDVDPDEDAVVLLEQDGMYQWVFADADRPQPRAHGRSLGRTLFFDLPVHTGPATRGLSFGSFRAWVLRFAKELLGAGVRLAENGVESGFVRLTSAAADTWAKAPDLTDLGVGTSARRMLLFVHGTFSSTLGSYGGLSTTAEGRRFLADADARYDALIGFDHPTLSLDPQENADKLLRGLSSHPWAAPPTIDVVAFSRGGLVWRSLTELVLPGATFKLRLGTTVHVAVPHAGTSLARRPRWRPLSDLYTNLAVASPGPRAGIRQIARGVGQLVRGIASAAIDAGAVPGLAAMDPDGRFLRLLNQAQPGQPDPAVAPIHCVTAAFDERLAGPIATLPGRLIDLLKEGLARQIFERDNDLVVDTASMTAIDVHGVSAVREQLAYGRQGEVHHLNHFVQDDLTDALRRWLLDGSRPTRAHDLPSDVVEDVLVLPADLPLRDALARLDATPAPFVAIHRDDEWVRGGWYPRPSELLRSDDDPTLRLIDLQALNIHESTSRAIQLDDLTAGVPDEPTVVLDGPRLVGVVAPEVHEAARPGRQPRGLAQAPGSVGAAPDPHRVPLFVRAALDPEVRLDRLATCEITIAREDLPEPAHGATGAAGADPERALVVQVFPRRNLTVEGESRFDVELPAPHAPLVLYVDVKGAAEGPARLDVVVRQGASALLTLGVRARVVAAPSPARAGAHQASGTAVLASAPPVDIVRLTVVENRIGDESRYWFELEHRDRGLLVAAWSPPVVDRDGYVADLYREMEEHYKLPDDDALRALVGFGSRLFGSLVPASVRSALWENRDHLHGMMVLSTEPFIPWEMLYLRGPDQAGGPPDPERFFAMKGLTRWLHDARRHPPTTLKVRDGGKARVLAPVHPGAAALPSAQEEVRFVKEELGAVDLAADQVYPLLEGGLSYDLLHIATHGQNDAGAIGEAALVYGFDFAGKKRTLRVSAVEGALRIPPGADPIVFLNCCQVGRGDVVLGALSGFPRAFVGAGAGMVVTPLWSVDDGLALTFARTFYERLLAGDPVAEATRAARQATAGTADPTWLAYAVYAHPHAKLVR